MPTYFVEVGQIGIGPAATLSALLPIAGIGGTLAIGWLVGKYLVGREVHALSGVLFGLALLFVVFTTLPPGLLTSTIMLALIGSLAYGATSLLLSTMAFVVGGSEETSSTAGLLDFAFNIGAGLSGADVGAVLDTQPWRTVFVLLGAVSFGAALLIFIHAVLNRRKGQFR